MAAKICSGFDSRRSYPRQDDANAFRRQSGIRKSAESVFSCVTNVSDTGTYEIEISERQSRDSGSLSRRAICSKTPSDSDCSDVSKCKTKSKTDYSVVPSKSENSLGKHSANSKNKLIQSYYPYFCIATLELSDNPKPRIDLVSKETNTRNTGGDRSGLLSKTVSSSSSMSSKKVKNDSSSGTDSEKKCASGRCSSSSSSRESSRNSSSSRTPSSSDFENSSERSKPSSRKTSKTSVTSKTNTTRSVDTDKSCNCTKCRNSARESTGTYTVLSDDKKGKESQMEKITDGGFPRVRTIQALELISEEKEKQWAEGVGEFRSCKCEMSGYEERLKNLENLRFSSKTVEEDDKTNTESGTESRLRSCECTATLNQFAEIKGRIEVLERLCMDSLGNKAQASVEKKGENSQLEGSIEEEYCTGEEKLKCEMKPLFETIDETTRTAIELAKIKKRLMDLEVKMMHDRPYRSSSSHSIKNKASFGRDKKVAVNITTTYITPPTSKLSDKEIQVIDFNGEQTRSTRTRDDIGFVAENKLATYWMMKKMNPWSKVVLRDEAIQAPSRKQMDPCSADSNFHIEPKDNSKKSKKSCDKIHLCKECDHYISQKIGRPRGESLEKLWNNRKLEENLPEKNKTFDSENFNKLKKSFKLYQINTSDYLAGKDSKKLSFLDETRRLLEKKPKKERKKFKLCSKCSQTNLNENVIANYETGVKYGARYPWDTPSKRFDKCCDSVKKWNEKSKKNAKNSFHSARMPHQAFQIYQTREMSHSLLLHPHSSRGKAFPTRHRRGVKSHKDRDLPKIYPLWSTPHKHGKVLYDCRHRPFSWATGYESWENTSYTVTTTALKDSLSTCSGSLRKKNRLNPFQYLRAGRKIKIPVLFEEICNSSENKLFEHRSSLSMRVVQVGVSEDGKNDLSPFKKLVRKFSHSQSMAYKGKFIPFGVSKCCCDNAVKADTEALQRQKKTNLFSLIRRTCL